MKSDFNLMPAAGWCKTVEQVRRLAAVPIISHIVMGSFTVQPREGNTGGANYFVDSDGTSYNALGLPNGGAPYLMEHLGEMVRVIKDSGKRPVLSIAGETEDEYATLTRIGWDHGVDVIEVNLSCPNRFVVRGFRSILGYSSETINRIALAVLARVQPGMEVWLKLPPYADPGEREEKAGLLTRLLHRGSGRIVVCNTFPHTVPRRGAALIITAENTKGRAGMGGTKLAPIAQANAAHFRELLPSSIDIVGVGGIRSGADASDWVNIGCHNLQVGTAFFGMFGMEDFGVFDRIAAEYRKGRTEF